jgi:predicted amidohydrolase
MNKIAALQMTSAADVEKNLTQAAVLIAKASQAGAKLIVLPENIALMGKSESDKLQICEKFGSGYLQDFFALQAQQNKVWIVAGTIPLKTENKNKIRAASLVFDSEGNCVARYDKIHLFDAQVQRNIETYEESRTVEAGNNVTVIDSPVGRLGLAVCYDIRFPELFRMLSLQGAEVIVIPAAFTVKTGTAHWELLMRARAVENICYTVGAAQTGTHENGRKTFGHSMIVNPWGDVIECLAEENGMVIAEINLKKLHEIREDFPVLAHRRITCEFKNNNDPC